MRFFHEIAAPLEAVEAVLNRDHGTGVFLSNLPFNFSLCRLARPRELYTTLLWSRSSPMNRFVTIQRLTIHDHIALVHRSNVHFSKKNRFFFLKFFEKLEMNEVIFVHLKLQFVNIWTLESHYSSIMNILNQKQ
jgi:hypothetical protein